MATPLEQWTAQAQAHWRLAVKYKWYILVSSLALALVFTVIIARFPNVYEATTTILVDPQQIPEKHVSPAANSDPSSRLNTLIQQVLSKTRLQEIIDQIPSNPAAESRTEFQDPCPAFVRWVVSNSNDDQFPDDLTRMQAPKKGNAPAKGKGPRKR